MVFGISEKYCQIVSWNSAGLGTQMLTSNHIWATSGTEFVLVTKEIQKTFILYRELVVVSYTDISQWTGLIMLNLLTVEKHA